MYGLITHAQKPILKMSTFQSIKHAFRTSKALQGLSFVAVGISITGTFGFYVCRTKTICKLVFCIVSVLSVRRRRRHSHLRCRALSVRRRRRHSHLRCRAPSVRRRWRHSHLRCRAPSVRRRRRHSCLQPLPRTITSLIKCNN